MGTEKKKPPARKLLYCETQLQINNCTHPELAGRSLAAFAVFNVVQPAEFHVCHVCIFLNINKKICALSETGPCKLEIFSCKHLDLRIFFYWVSKINKFSVNCFGNCKIRTCSKISYIILIIFRTSAAQNCIYIYSNARPEQKLKVNEKKMRMKYKII